MSTDKVCADAKVLVSDTVCKNGKACVSGIVEFTVLYIPDEENTELKCMSHDFDFSTDLDIKADENTEFVTTANAEHIGFTLVNSRKLSAKVMVAIKTCSYHDKCYEPIIEMLGDDIEKIEKKASVIAKRIRGAVPEGRSYRPAMIYPKRVSPPGEPVPGYPEAMNRFLETPVEEKEFDLEMNEFVLPEGYRSADGKLTDKSVIWHPETHEVELGLEGEEKEIWNYLKVTDDSEVFHPGEWSTDYQIRLFQQKFANLDLEALQRMMQ